MTKLEGTTAVVTGAASGIGLELARLFAERSMNVVMADIEETRLDECHVLNTCSMAALTTLPLAGVYHMTKHAALALSESLFHDLAMTAPQIGVSCLCPELVDTGIADSARNRPAELSEACSSETHDMAMAAITDATAGSTTPRELAERSAHAIENNIFYVLPPEGNPWHATAQSRLEDIRLARNPTFAPPEI